MKLIVEQGRWGEGAGLRKKLLGFCGRGSAGDGACFLAAIERWRHEGRPLQRPALVWEAMASRGACELPMTGGSKGVSSKGVAAAKGSVRAYVQKRSSKGVSPRICAKVPLTGRRGIAKTPRPWPAKSAGNILARLPRDVPADRREAIPVTDLTIIAQMRGLTLGLTRIGSRVSSSVACCVLDR